MLPTFLSQFAAGCYLAVSVSAIKQSGWRYLRLLAIVSLCLAFLAILFLLKDPVSKNNSHTTWINYGLGISAVFGTVWLFINAGQQDRVTDSQRLFPGIAGISSMVAAVALTLRPDLLIRYPGADRIAIPEVALTLTTILGAALLGTVTAAMLLGHRYLTDTDMSILPLRRLTRIYVGILLVRFVWLGIASIPIWSDSFRPRGNDMWFWLMICIRGGVGILGTGVFAWMVWDCVRRRATQSATALYYLSMIFVFIGELAGQYLTRTESLAM